MTTHCPGQFNRQLKAEIHKCPNCGYDVEMFNDETRVRCFKCKEWVYREKTPTCIEWCPSARQCLGEERWKAIMGELTDQKPTENKEHKETGNG